MLLNSHWNTSAHQHPTDKTLRKRWTHFYCNVPKKKKVQIWIETMKRNPLRKSCELHFRGSWAGNPSGSGSLSRATLTVDTAGAAVERVVDEEMTVDTEHTETRWTAEHLRTGSMQFSYAFKNTFPCPTTSTTFGGDSTHVLTLLSLSSPWQAWQDLQRQSGAFGVCPSWC